MELLNWLRIKLQMNKNLKQSGYNRKQFKKSMKEWQNRELDIEEILSRDYSPNVIIDAYEYCMRKCSWDVSQMQNSSVKVFLLCIIFQGEIENGGITQFLSNSSGNMTSETIDALKRIDEVYADMLMKAAHFFPEGIVPKNQKNRNDIMDNFDDEKCTRLDELDRKVYEHDIFQKVYDFLQTHKIEFLIF